jgi:SsrA-binding protein
VECNPGGSHGSAGIFCIQPMGKKRGNRELAESALATNRRARRDYVVLESLEAGIELLGTEVKSIRQHRVSLSESYASIIDGELWLLECHVDPYEYGNVHNHDPKRRRRLLMHREEIERLRGQIAEKGLTLAPLQMFLNRGRVKVQLGLCRGKQIADKRETLKRRTADLETARAVSDAMRRR